MDNHLFALSLQMGVSVALSFLLLEIYKKLRHESFVFYWALFWACQAAAPVFGLSYLHRTESNLWLPLAVSCIIVLLFQPTLMASAAMSLRERRPRYKTQFLVFGATVALAIGVAVFAPSGSGGLYRRLGAAFLARAFLNAMLVAWFATTIAGERRLAKRTSGKLTIVLSGAYSLHLLLLSFIQMGISIYESPGSSEALLMGILLPLGITCAVMVSVLEDAQAAAADALQSNRRFRALLEDIRLLGIMVDATGKVTFCNDFFLAVTGWSRAEVLDRNWFETVVPEEERKHRQSEHVEAMRTGIFPWYLESSVMTKQGNRRQIQWTITALQSPQGQAIGAAAIGYDVTDHRLLEESYRQAQKMEAIGQLAGGIAHDFNNLLTVITCCTNLILHDLDAKSQHGENIQQIQLAADRAASLTRQLLAFSRRQALQPQLLDLNVLLGNLEKMLCRLISENIELVTVKRPDLWKVKADPVQIEQVIINLAVNARDAMPEGGRLFIEVANVELNAEYACRHADCRPGPAVRLSVQDTGHGMEPAVLSRIFDPFFTTKEPGKGTGLGLPTVYGIVRQSEGHITVDSAPGTGTTFHVYFPQATAGLSQNHAQMSAARLAPGSETILLAEDDAPVREMANRILRRQGYTVLVAKDGREALDICNTHSGPIDLLLTDIVMPEITGPSLARSVRELRPELRMLYMSGYSELTISNQDLLGSDILFLEKPFTPEHLISKIRAVLGTPMDPLGAKSQAV